MKCLRTHNWLRTTVCMCAVCLCALCRYVPQLHADSIDTDRKVENLWKAYVPVLHHRLAERIVLDDTTIEALRARGAPTQVTLRIRLDKHARISVVEVAKASAVEGFTHAVATATRNLGRLPYLAPELIQRARQTGLEFTFGTQ